MLLNVVPRKTILHVVPKVHKVYRDEEVEEEEEERKPEAKSRSKVEEYYMYDRKQRLSEMIPV